jgi:hypothetical protein
MSNDLDELLARLARVTPEASLDGLEDAVLSGVARRRESARAANALAPVRAASVGVALAVGMAAGGMAGTLTATERHRLDTFSSAAHLAPSTLLAGDE